MRRLGLSILHGPHGERGEHPSLTESLYSPNLSLACALVNLVVRLSELSRILRNMVYYTVFDH